MWDCEIGEKGARKRQAAHLATTATTCDILPFERASLCIVFCPYEIVFYIYFSLL